MFWLLSDERMAQLQNALAHAASGPWHTEPSDIQGSGPFVVAADGGSIASDIRSADYERDVEGELRRAQERIANATLLGAAWECARWMVILGKDRRSSAVRRRIDLERAACAGLSDAALVAGVVGRMAALLRRIEWEGAVPDNDGEMAAGCEWCGAVRFDPPKHGARCELGGLLDLIGRAGAAGVDHNDDGEIR